MKRNLLALTIIVTSLFTTQDLIANCAAGQVEIKITVTPYYFPSEISWELVRNSDQAVIASRGCGFYTNSNPDETILCVSDSEGYTFKSYDDYGDGWNLGSYEISYVATGCVIVSGIPNNSSWGDFTSTCVGLDLEASVLFNPGNLTQGCTDPSALNYDPCAMISDSSCTYSNLCGGGEATVVIKVESNIFSSDIGWVLLDSNSDTIAQKVCGSVDTVSYDTVCLLSTETYTFEAYDDFGDGWNGGEYSIYFAQNGCVIASGIPNNFYSGDILRDCMNSDLEESININMGTSGQGCKDPNATNFDPCAVTDDGSCIFKPANDLCINATLIQCGDTIDGSTLFAADTLQPSSECGTNPEAAGVWYKIIGNGQDVTISTCGSSFDTKINIYKGPNCDPSILQSKCIGGNDDACGIQSSITFATAVNKTYYILINGYRGDVGLFSFEVSCTAPCTPSVQHDVCGNNAQEIILQYEGNCSRIVGDNSCAYVSTSSLNCDRFNSIKDVWYTFNTGESTDLFFDIDTGTASEVKFALYTNCSTAPIYCVEAGVGGLYEFTNLEANRYYYLQIWNNGYGSEGTFDFCIYDTGAVSVCNDTIPFVEEDEIFTTSASLVWGSVPNDIAYVIKGKAVGASNFSYFDIPSATTEFTMTPLSPNTQYEWQVAKVCDTSTSLTGPYTESRTFSTPACLSPDFLFASDITENSARLNWEAYEEVTGYMIMGRELGKPIVTLYIYDPLQDYLDVVLASNTTYEWTALSLCGVINGPIRAVDTFTTLTQGKGIELEEKPLTFDKPEISIYPNPVTTEFSITLDVEVEAPFTYELISIDGKIIMEGEHIFTNSEPLTLMREELESGVYHVRVFNDNFSYLEKVVLR
ncbi:MAG: T9SS type A sorting domain-containing protein [Chitinophagales bacterium]|nr:T9SS type A sorting domain-containing protein [Chitinophagales bacterium]